MTGALRTVLHRMKSLFSTGPSRPPVFDAPIAPDTLFYAVGDIHGRVDLLEPLLEKIDADQAVHGAGTPPPLVFLGDYVDRGDHSAQVLEKLFALARDFPDQVVCLMGNHERMMLEFLDDPAGRGTRWLRNGGLQTLASYRIGGLGERAGGEELMEACEALEQALPKGMEAWMRALPLRWQSGNICCVHAAMDPHLAPEDQARRTLLWGHPDFFTQAREDGVWAVHGHTIVANPERAGGRIAIDTGAYYSGRLTAAAISAGECRFL